jgi:15-cis-phytoene desaturase
MDDGPRHQDDVRWDMIPTYDAVVIGSGLSGLSAACQISQHKKNVLLLEGAPQVGGRTSNWKRDGMDVESGIHKFTGVYKELPALIRSAGLRMGDLFEYHDEVEIRVAEGGDRNAHPRKERRSGRFGAAPLFAPIKTLLGALGNVQILSLWDKWKLMRITSAGLAEYLKYPDHLDTMSIAQYFKAHGASDNLINTVVWSLSGGLFFIPPERYSAHAFFSLMWVSTKRSLTSRVAIFKGGMTDVMCKPIADHCVRRGGELRLNTRVDRLLVEDGRVVGVVANGQSFRAPRVVLATNLAPAQKIIQASFSEGPEDRELQKLLSMPSMSAVAVQLELDHPVEPDDHVVFGPNSILGTFGEQSHTTFSHSRGRISTFLSPPEPFMAMADEDVVRAVIADLKRQGIDVDGRVRQSAVVRHPSEFYLLEPGSEAKRPLQRTGVPGLALAGDYTRQPAICTMEGAVVAGRLAAEAVMTNVSTR